MVWMDSVWPIVFPRVARHRDRDAEELCGSCKEQRLSALFVWNDIHKWGLQIDAEEAEMFSRVAHFK